MAYNLIITERADELVDRLAAYLVKNLKNPDAASHFLDELESVYNRLEENPFQFAESKDEYLYIFKRIIIAFKDLKQFQNVQFDLQSKNNINYTKFYKEIFNIINYSIFTGVLYGRNEEKNCYSGR